MGFDAFSGFLWYYYNKSLLEIKMSYSEDESIEIGGSTQPHTRFRFDKNIESRRLKILKNNQRKYNPRKPNVLLCIALGVFLLPGLLLYLGGLFIYNKVSEYKFNQAQAKDIQEANDAKTPKPPIETDLSESGNTFAKTQRSLSRSKRASSRSSDSKKSPPKKSQAQVEVIDSSAEYTGSEEGVSEEDTQSPPPGSPTGLIK